MATSSNTSPMTTAVREPLRLRLRLSAARDTADCAVASQGRADWAAVSGRTGRRTAMCFVCGGLPLARHPAGPSMASPPYSIRPVLRSPREAQMTAQTAWCEEVQFAPEAASPAKARKFVERHLGLHELVYLVEDVRLVVSELVTNAVVHADTLVRVRIEEVPFCVKLTVYDESMDLPVLALQDRAFADAEHGRGLCVTEACSAHWGTDLGRGGGKSVWALFAVRPKSSWVG